MSFRNYSWQGVTSPAGDDVLGKIAYRRSVSVEGIGQPNITETRGYTSSLYTSINVRLQSTFQMLAINMARFDHCLTLWSFPRS